MIILFCSNLVQFGPLISHKRPFISTLSLPLPEKTDCDNLLHLPILLKYDRAMLHYRPRDQNPVRPAGRAASSGNASLITIFLSYNFNTSYPGHRSYILISVITQHVF